MTAGRFSGLLGSIELETNEVADTISHKPRKKPCPDLRRLALPPLDVIVFMLTVT